MNLPPDLAEAVRRGQAVLVAGPGCGALAGQPDWRGRLEALAAALPARGGGEVRALLQRGALVAALVTARDRLGPQAARVVAAVTTAGPERVPAVLTALAAAPWRAVITTGFDEIWSRALASSGEAPIVLSAGDPLVAEGGRLLIHAFGRATKPDSICLAPVDLPERVTAHGLEDFLRELARANSFVYVGFQPEDPDLEWLAGRVLGPAALERPHFALIAGGASVTTSLFRGTFGLQPLPHAGTLEGGLAVLAGAVADAAETEAPESNTAELELDDIEEPPPLPSSSLGRSIREGIDRAMEEQRWADAADGLRGLIELEADPSAKAKLLHARALLLRDVLQDRNGAIAQLELALEADPGMVAAWDALEPLHRAGGDPAALRRRYARALRALGKSADRDLALRLWNGLAEVSWRALGDTATAVASLEAARTLNPDDEGPERQLATLYLKMGDGAADRAVAAHQGLAARVPDEPEPYRVLERLWITEQEPRKASWAAAVLTHLGQATDQTRPLELSRPAHPTLARTLSEPLWECLYHPDEDRVLSTLFTVLAPSLLPLMHDRPRAFPPKRADLIAHVDASPTRPSRTTAGPVSGGFAPAALAHVAGALEVPAPALYLVPTARRPITLHLRVEALSGRNALVLDRRFAERAAEAELIFDLARTVALLRPPWFLALGARALEALDLGLRAAEAIEDAEPPRQRDLRRLLQHLREERPDLVQAQLSALASELNHRKEPPDLARWLAGVQLSAARAALVLAGDLEAAVRRTSADDQGPGGLAPGERVKDLLAFAVSDDHFSVREALALDPPELSAALG